MKELVYLGFVQLSVANISKSAWWTFCDSTAILMARKQGGKAMSLGERIYKLRTEKEMSQGDLADALEVSRQSISKWETGNCLPDSSLGQRTDFSVKPKKRLHTVRVKVALLLKWSVQLSQLVLLLGARLGE